MKKYKYVPSTHISEGSKYYVLTQKYTPLIQSFLNGGIKSEEKSDLYIGLDLISNYIYNGFFFFIKESFESKLNYEKIIISMYYRIMASDSHYLNIHNDIKDLAEKSVFLSIGIESLNKKNFLWNNKECLYDNFIKHTTEKVFKPLLYEYFKEKTILFDNIDTLTLLSSESIEEELSANDIIYKSGLSDMIPSNIKDLIINYLDNGEDKYVNKIKPYLLKIYEEINKTNNLN